MLHIRPEQMRQLEAAVLQAFEDRTLAHLKHYFPGHCALLGESQMRLVIRKGRLRAASHGLTFENCARSYIDFMCLLGSGFDLDPLLPWAGETLADVTSFNQVACGDRLYDRAWSYIRSVMPNYRDGRGRPSTARFVTELRSLMQRPDRPLPDDALPGYRDDLAALLERVFPAKSGTAGQQAVRVAVASALSSARAYRITGERGMAVFAVLQFVLGAEFDRDPLLPWASAVLQDGSLTEEKQRVDALVRQGVSTLRRWWKLSPQLI